MTDNTIPEESGYHLLKNITKDSYVPYYIRVNSFCLFKSIDKILYLIYASEACSIISFDLINDKRINEIKKAHSTYISSFRHYLDGINKRDLIISVSTIDNNIKVWNIKNYECICNIKNIYEESVVLSACFINENNSIFIVASNEPHNIFEETKVFDLNGNKYKEIYNYDDLTRYIDSYYDKNLSKNFIVTGNVSYPRSYDYNSSKLYHKYADDNNKEQYYIFIFDKDDVLELIESSQDQFIRIWDFHSGKLLNKIKLDINKYYTVYSFCASNNNVLFGGTGNDIIIIDLKTQKVDSFSSGYNQAFTIQIIEHSKFGECLISQGSLNSPIKLWIKDKKNL